MAEEKSEHFETIGYAEVPGWSGQILIERIDDALCFVVKVKDGDQLLQLIPFEAITEAARIIASKSGQPIPGTKKHYA